MENDFQGLEGQQMPEMSDDFVEKVSNRYIDLYEKITGETFEKELSGDIIKRVEKNIVYFLQQ